MEFNYLDPAFHLGHKFLDLFFFFQGTGLQCPCWHLLRCPSPSPGLAVILIPTGLHWTVLSALQSSIYPECSLPRASPGKGSILQVSHLCQGQEKALAAPTLLSHLWPLLCRYTREATLLLIPLLERNTANVPPLGPPMGREGQISSPSRCHTSLELCFSLCLPRLHLGRARRQGFSRAPHEALAPFTAASL